MMTVLLGRMARKAYDDSRQELHRLACSEGGGDVSAFTERLCAELSTRYLCRRKGRKPAIREELLERYSAELAEACGWLRESCEGYCLSVRRRVSMARIEYPLLSHKVAEGMGKKGIPYLFRTLGDENVLTVQVVCHHFYDIPLSLETLDRVMSMLPYCIARPEYALEELPQIRKRVSFWLEKSWKTISSGGSV